MDTDAAHQGGPGPMEMVLMALCGCTSVDVVSILRKKREPLTSLTVSAVAEQATEAPRVFTHIQLTYHIGGGVSHKAAEDAVALSKNKYCSVSKMLEKSAKIDYVITYGEPA
jgi:putative redox protein